jgi:hypothetical protein
MTLLALPDPAAVDRGGHLDHLVTVGDHADEQLGGLVLRLFEPDGAGHLGPHRPQAERRVADPLPGERAEREREEEHARSPDRVLCLLAA